MNKAKINARMQELEKTNRELAAAIALIRKQESRIYRLLRVVRHVRKKRDELREIMGLYHKVTNKKKA